MFSNEEMEKQIAILLEQCQYYVETGQYSETYNVIKGIEKSKANGILPGLLDTFIEHLHTEEFIASLVNSFRLMGRLMREEAAALCNYYGEKIIPELFDALVEEESKATRKFIITLIAGSGNGSVTEAIQRLDDDRWFVKRNMIFILKECGGREVIPHVKPYCQHENLQVRSEAIACLLQKGDRDGAETVMKNLRSNSKEIVNQAITLSGSFRVNEAVPELLELLDKKGVTGVDFLDKIPIVVALGKIGDPSAMKGLRNIIFSTSILFKSAIDRLKEEAFKTLKNYPLNDVRELAEAGSKSKNEVIRSESLKLLKRGRKKDVISREDHHGTT
jgi:HEAT repeat protein